MPDADEIVVEAFDAIPGGYSRETFRFDCRVRRGGGEELLPMILRKDPPAVAALLNNLSREIEHDLIEAVRAHTSVPVAQSHFHVMDPGPFGEPAMIIQRAHGSGQTSNLFNDGPDADQAESVCAHLCESSEGFLCHRLH